MLDRLKNALDAIRTAVPATALRLDLEAQAIERDLADREGRRERIFAA